MTLKENPGVKDTTSSHTEQKHSEGEYKQKFFQEHLYSLNSRRNSVLLKRDNSRELHITEPTTNKC